MKFEEVLYVLYSTVFRVIELHEINIEMLRKSLVNILRILDRKTDLSVYIVKC